MLPPNFIVPIALGAVAVIMPNCFKNNVRIKLLSPLINLDKITPESLTYFELFIFSLSFCDNGFSDIT